MGTVNPLLRLLLPPIRLLSNLPTITTVMVTIVLTKKLIVAPPEQPGEQTEAGIRGLLTTRTESFLTTRETTRGVILVTVSVSRVVIPGLLVAIQMLTILALLLAPAEITPESREGAQPRPVPDVVLASMEWSRTTPEQAPIRSREVATLEAASPPSFAVLALSVAMLSWPPIQVAKLDSQAGAIKALAIKHEITFKIMVKTITSYYPEIMVPKRGTRLTLLIALPPRPPSPNTSLP